MSYHLLFIQALISTLAIEVGLLLIICRYYFRPQCDNIKKIIFTGIVASSLTLPYLWFFAPHYLNLGQFAPLLFVELIITFIESIVYHQFLQIKYSKAFLLSFILNFCSVIFGLLWDYYILGLPFFIK